MKRIAISQRVVEHIDYPERRDALDQRWPPLLEMLDIVPIPIPNSLADPKRWFRQLEITGLLLTGGNDLSLLSNPTEPAPERDATERAVLELCEQQMIPVFGVCRGLQLLVAHHGGKLERCEGHVAVRHKINPSSNLGLPLEVNSYHSMQIVEDSLPKSMTVLGISEDGQVEAIRHNQFPQLGIMWHPEREESISQEDLNLISTHFGLAQ